MRAIMLTIATITIIYGGNFENAVPLRIRNNKE